MDRDSHLIFSKLMRLTGHGHRREITRQPLGFFINRLLLIGRLRRLLCGAYRHLGDELDVSAGSATRMLVMRLERDAEVERLSHKKMPQIEAITRQPVPDSYAIGGLVSADGLALTA